MSMELDDLKSIWKQKIPYEAKHAEQIASMLKGSSNSIIAKLKRSVWFELLLTIGFGLVLLVYAFTLKSGATKWSVVSILLLFLIYTFYYSKKLKLLNSFSPSENNLKESIERLVKSLTEYLQFYKTSYTVLYPVYFFMGILFTAIELGFDVFWNKLGQPETILKLILVGLIFLILSLVISKWYLQKLYGNHLDKLKSILKDLEDSTGQG